jgi:hypothetical protein
LVEVALVVDQLLMPLAVGELVVTFIFKTLHFPREA